MHYWFFPNSSSCFLSKFGIAHKYTEQAFHIHSVRNKGVLGHTIDPAIPMIMLGRSNLHTCTTEEAWQNASYRYLCKVSSSFAFFVVVKLATQVAKVCTKMFNSATQMHYINSKSKQIEKKKKMP